jgi:hypothetical protein
MTKLLKEGMVAGARIIDENVEGNISKVIQVGLDAGEKTGTKAAGVMSLHPTENGNRTEQKTVPGSQAPLGSSRTKNSRINARMDIDIITSNLKAERDSLNISRGETGEMMMEI